MENLLKKLCIALFITCIAATVSVAQRPHLLFGANASYNNPKGAFSNSYKWGVAGEVFAGIGVSKTYLVGTLGTSYFSADKENSYGRLIYNPVKLGVRQFLVSNKVFINGDVGVGYVKDKSMSNSESKLTRGIGAGARLLGLEGSIYYNGWKALHAPGFSNSVQFKVGWSMTL